MKKYLIIYNNLYILHIAEASGEVLTNQTYIVDFLHRAKIALDAIGIDTEKIDNYKEENYETEE